MSAQRPLQLILARNLLSTLSTPAFLVGDEGVLLHFNEAAAAMLGRRFEEIGRVAAEDWTKEFGPFDEHDEPIPYDEVPATIAGRGGRPYHGQFRVCTADGKRDVEASMIPIVGPGGATGAIVFFWPAREGEGLAGTMSTPGSEEQPGAEA